MDFRRNSQRRRRVAIDQNQLETTPGAKLNSKDPPSSDDSRVPSSPYTHEARRSRQPKTTDLIPKRLGSVIAVVAIFLAGIAGLNILHLHAHRWVDVIGQNGVEIFSLDSDRGLSVWYSNFLLLLSSCASLQIFLIRQHRRDDYRGSYRVWLWLAAIFMLGSLATVTAIQDLIQNVINFLLSTGAGKSLGVMVGIKLSLLMALVARGIFEIRHSRAALIGLSTVLLAYAAVVVMDLPEVHSKVSNNFETAYGSILLLGNTALFLTVLLFARFVYLEANGVISISSPDAIPSTGRQNNTGTQPSKPKQTRKASADKAIGHKQTVKSEQSSQGEAVRKAKSPSTSKQSRTVDTHPAQTKPVQQKNTSKSRPPKPMSDDDALLMMMDDDEVASLSKSERRRLRKLKKRQQRQAA